MSWGADMLTDTLSRESIQNPEAAAGERERFRGYLARLTYAAGTFDFAPGRQTPDGGRGARSEHRRRVRPGFFLHSLLGLGLRSVGCAERPPCPGPCRRPNACAYGRLLEPRPGASGPPLSGVERAPVPLAIDAPWEMYEPGKPLRFRMILLGEAANLRGAVTEALSAAFMPGARGLLPTAPSVASAWQEGGAADSGARAFPLSARISVRIDFTTPVRIVREGKELEAFDLGSLVRDASFRLATWGHYHQGLEWPDPWRFLQDDAVAVRAVEQDIGLVRFRRYSGRQNRAIPMKGLLGWIRLAGVSADLALLLSAAALCGLGKGASIGLGRIRLGWS